MPSGQTKSTAAFSARTLLLFALGLALLAMPLALNVMNRVQAEHRMQQAVEQMSAQVKLNEKKLAQLSDAATYAKSDAYVEHWARVQQRWVRNGEIPVISPAADQIEVTPQPWWEQFLNQ